LTEIASKVTGLEAVYQYNNELDKEI